MISEDSPTKTIRVKYDHTHALFANQVLLKGSSEEVVLDFSSGPVADPDSGETVVPVHTRVAMTPQGARRLLSALKQALQRQENSPAEGS